MVGPEVFRPLDELVEGSVILRKELSILWNWQQVSFPVANCGSLNTFRISPWATTLPHSYSKNDEGMVVIKPSYGKPAEGMGSFPQMVEDDKTMPFTAQSQQGGLLYNIDGIRTFLPVVSFSGQLSTRQQQTPTVSEIINRLSKFIGHLHRQNHYA